MIKTFFILGLGMFGGLWIAWPGISDKDNWHCVKEIISKSNKDETDIRTIMSVSPRYLIKKKSDGPFLKIRLIGDTCFR